MVEKIKRDVRITTIYEGTSEIMEMTIARDRWQQHLKTARRLLPRRGARARWRTRGTRGGADVAALALECLAGVLEACRVGRLTRNQHILLRLGELVAYAECAGALARRAQRRPQVHCRTKADRRFEPPRWPRSAGSSRARRRYKVAEEGLRWVAGRGHGCATWPPPCRWSGYGAAQTGLLADMDRGRRTRSTPTAREPDRHDDHDGRRRRHRRRRRDHARRAGRGGVLGQHQAGRYSISDVPPERWDPELYYDPDPHAPDKTYSKIGGWVRDFGWEPLAWRLPDPARGRRPRWTTARSGRWPAPARRCSTPAGRTGRWTPSAPP